VRGYENLIFDMVDEEPRLYELIQMVEEFNMAIIKRYIELGAEWIGYPEDLGMQVGPMLSPPHFCRYIKPSYQRLMAPARKAGCIVHMHSDGDIRSLVDDLVDGGVEVINLQDLVNGIDWIADKLAGKICIDLDIDRQRITRFGTPVPQRGGKAGQRPGRPDDGLWPLSRYPARERQGADGRHGALCDLLLVTREKGDTFLELDGKESRLHNDVVGPAFQSRLLKSLGIIAGIRQSQPKGDAIRKTSI